MVPHTHVIKPQVAQDIFSGLDHAQLLRADRLAVRDARTEARHLRFVGRRQTEVAGQFSDLRLRQAGLFQRRADLEFGGGLGAVMAWVLNRVWAHHPPVWMCPVAGLLSMAGEALAVDSQPLEEIPPGACLQASLPVPP